MTPFEAWSGHKPYVTHFRIFGSKAWDRIQIEKEEGFAAPKTRVPIFWVLWRFKRSHTIKLLMRNPIMDVGCIFYSLGPKLWWQSLSLHHVGRHLLQWPVLSLSNTIFIWCVRDRMLHLNIYIFTILNELGLDILTAIVRSEDIEFPPILVFNQGFKDFE